MLVSAPIPAITLAPSPNPVVGQIYYDVKSNKMKMYDGIRWKDVMHNMYVSDLELECGEQEYSNITWYTVRPHGGIYSDRQKSWDAMDEWCTQTLGQGIIGSKPKGDAWEPDCRWLVNNGKFWFRRPADRTMFLLRFS